MQRHSFLDKPLPYFRSYRDPINIVLGISIFIFLFCFIYRPYAYHAPATTSWAWIALGFASVALVVVGLTHLVLFRFIPVGRQHAHWNAKREILFGLINILLAGTGNYFLALVYLDGPETLEGFFHIIGFTAAIGIFPGIGIWIYKTQWMVLDPVSAEEPPTTVEFLGSNGKISLSIPLQQLSFLESEGNYIRIHYWEGNTLKKQLIRNRMNALEQHLLAYPGLVRCHRSFLVNLDQVTNVRGNRSGYKLTLREIDDELPVSRGYTVQFEEAIRAWPTKTTLLSGDGQYSVG